MVYDWKITAWKAMLSALVVLLGALVAGMGSIVPQTPEIMLIVAVATAVMNYAKHYQDA